MSWQAASGHIFVLVFASVLLYGSAHDQGRTNDALLKLLERSEEGPKDSSGRLSGSALSKALLTDMSALDIADTSPLDLEARADKSSPPSLDTNAKTGDVTNLETKHVRRCMHVCTVYWARCLTWLLHDGTFLKQLPSAAPPLPRSAHMLTCCVEPVSNMPERRHYKYLVMQR